jgi:hypothetical protein
MGVEKEIRGKFHDESSLIRLKDEFEEGYYKDHRYRLSVIYTTLNREGIDLQVRLLNKTGEVVLKRGKHTSSERHETLFHFNIDEFMSVITVFDKMGMNDGVIAVAEDWKYVVDNIETKLTICDNKIFCWEIESLSPDKSTDELIAFAKSHGLKQLSEDELAEYWLWMKRYANKPYSLDLAHKIYEQHKKLIK